MLGRLYSAREDVNTLSTAYDEIGARLDIGVNELEVEAVNKESSTTKPKDLDAALELAGMTRDQMIQKAALSQFAPGWISSTRVLALLEECRRSPCSLGNWAAADRSAQSIWRLVRRIRERIHSFVRSVRHLFSQRVTYIYDSFGNTVVFWDLGLGCLYTSRLRDVALCPPLGGRSAVLSITPI
ncbi:MAG: hypothetical protein ACKVIW_15070, partial [bacterium]